MGIVKTDINQQVANTTRNQETVQQYVAFNNGGGHRIYRGDFTNFSLFDLLMMLGFTATHTTKPKDVINIKRLSCYLEDQPVLLDLIKKLEVV